MVSSKGCNPVLSSSNKQLLAHHRASIPAPLALEGGMWLAVEVWPHIEHINRRVAQYHVSKLRESRVGFIRRA